MARKRYDISDRIVSVDEAEPYVKVLAYGRNGSGKTRFAATAPNVLIIDINERGTRSARHSGASVFHVRKWEDITHAYWYLREGNHKFKSVALDTITAMQHMCMRHVLRESAERDPNKDPKMPAQRDWGKLAELMKPLLLYYRNLPMHVIFTAQERVVGDDDEGGTVEHVPDLSPGSRGVATGAVEIIGRMYQREVRKRNKRGRVRSLWETRMLVGPHDEYTSKDRTGKLGRIVRAPTMEQIINASFDDGRE